MTRRENILVFAAIVTTLLAILAFLGVRQYTDIFGGAKITSIKIGKGTEINSEDPVFSPNEQVHATMKLSNISEGSKLEANVLYYPSGLIGSGKIVSGSERTWEVNDDSTVIFWYSTNGWATGVYKLEVKLTDRANQQRDWKTSFFRLAVNE
jgi:hypothetical protein